MDIQELKAVKEEVDFLGERIDEGISTERIAVWLYSIVASLINQLIKDKGGES